MPVRKDMSRAAMPERSCSRWNCLRHALRLHPEPRQSRNIKEICQATIVQIREAHSPQITNYVAYEMCKDCAWRLRFAHIASGFELGTRGEYDLRAGFPIGTCRIRTTVKRDLFFWCRCLAGWRLFRRALGRWCGRRRCRRRSCRLLARLCRFSGGGL
jgi:hypothetical protein